MDLDQVKVDMDTSPFTLSLNSALYECGGDRVANLGEQKVNFCPETGFGTKIGKKL